jgi:hypothetical protein
MFLLTSQNKFFSIEIPSEWSAMEKDGIYNLYNKNFLEGIFQITAYYNIDKIYNYEEDYNAYIDYKCSEFYVDGCKGLNYEIERLNENILDLRWIIGKKHIKIFMTLILNKKQDKLQIEIQKKSMENIIKSLVIYNPII